MRTDQATLTPAQQNTFKSAFQSLVNDGRYATLIAKHEAPGHRRHGGEGVAGSYRFLPWHRRFLLEFETLLQDAQRLQGVTAANTVGIPYWRWVDPFPAWLDNFLPVVNQTLPPRARTKGPPGTQPAQADVAEIMNRSNLQFPLEGPPINDYVRFSYALEGWGTHSSGAPLIAHNHLHAWVGGVMDLIPLSPADPVFWLVHSEVDRLWHIWQTAHPGESPPFMDNDHIMDPYAETFDQLKDVSKLGYQYDSSTF